MAWTLFFGRGARGALFFAAVSVYATIPPAPVAKKIPVTDDYFRTKIGDPYRWMEEPHNPDLTAYLKAQNDRTRAILDSIPERAPLLARIRALAQTIDSTQEAVRRRGILIYQKLTPASKIAKLYVRDEQGERILVDPDKFAQGGQHQAISFWAPSDSGAYVAVGLSRGGSENAVLHIFETANGRELPEKIDRTDFGVTSWREDGKAFYYMRRQFLPNGAPPTAKYQNIKTYLHVLGTDPEIDPSVFGIGLSPAVSFTPDDSGAVEVTPDSPYALGMVIHGVQNELTIYVAPKRELDGGHAEWKKVVDVDDGVTEAALHERKLYLLTHKDALRFKVVETDAVAPDFARAQLIVPPSERVVEHLAAARGSIYVQSLEEGMARITRVDWDGHRSEVKLPFDGTLTNLSTEYDDPGFLAKLEGWIVSPRWYTYDPKRGSLKDVRLDPPSPVDFSSVTTEEVKVRALDGVMVPLSIIRPKSAKFDGSNPTIVFAYGSYGLNASPNFQPVRMAWFERGGIYAIAHVRGGGEYGEEWHLAGKGVNKVKTVSDFVDCSRWLIEHGYASPAKISGRGGSAGGITMGMAIADAPQLFAAILDEIPVSDQLRIEFTANGPNNIPEFGSVRTQKGFNILYATSPVHHLHLGGLYPAVMLTTGANDPRVDPWQAAKMAATLQADSASGKPILLRVDYEGGHGLIGATKDQAAILAADEYSFLLWNMGVKGFQPKN